MANKNPDPIDDPVLGTLTPHIQAGEFDGVWEGSVNLPCFAQPLVFWVMTMRPENYFNKDYVLPDFSLSPLQSKFFQDFVADCSSYKQKFLKAILRGLKEDPTVWGMFDEDSEEYELISSISNVRELEQHLAVPHLYLLPDADNHTAFGFGYWEPAWDEEHGYGVRFVNGELVEAGPMEVAQG